MKNRPVLFFDGVCGLCSASVDFVFKYDKKNIFLFSPLQSEYARRELPGELASELSTLVVQDEGLIYTKSDAVLRILFHLGGIWNLLRIVRLVPKKFRDFVYDLIATYRYRWFGKKETCRLPNPEEKLRFLLS